jgi:hypothetical protein
LRVAALLFVRFSLPLSSGARRLVVGARALSTETTGAAGFRACCRTLTTLSGGLTFSWPPARAGWSLPGSATAETREEALRTDPPLEVSTGDELTAG